MVEDDTLAEHDAKYHPDGFKQGVDCNKREGMESDDPADTDISKDAKKASQGKKEKSEESAKKNAELADQWRKYLRSIQIEKLSETMHKYDDGNHGGLMKLILEEIERRDDSTIEARLKRMGEKV